MTNGAEGWCPPWYITLMTAKHLLTQPWVIDDDPQPVAPRVWGWRTQAALSAEHRAAQVVREQQEHAQRERQWETDRQARLKAAMKAGSR